MPTMSAPAALASSALAPWANTATRLVLPVPAGSTDGAAHDLVGLLGVDAQLHGDVDRFVELGGGAVLDDASARRRSRIQLGAVDLALQRGLLSSSAMFRPFHRDAHRRAEPAMVFTAASMSAAVRSFILVLAISSSWAR